MDSKVILEQHGRLQGLEEIVVGFKSARRQMAKGVGERGTAMSESTCYEKLRSLQSKGCVQIVGTERGGTRVGLFLPSEMREANRCFYCLRTVDNSNYVIEHVISRPIGNNGYRNLVAACLACNNQKDDLPVEEFIRRLALRRLQAGEIKPTFLVTSLIVV